jgi:hypothetical protein
VPLTPFPCPHTHHTAAGCFRSISTPWVHMSLQLRRHPRCPSGVMTVLLRLVPLAALLLLLLLVAIPTQAFLPPQARPPRLSSTFLHPRWPPSPCRVHSTKRSSQKQQQQQQHQDTPPQPKEIKGNALKDLERRLKGHSGDDKNPVPFAYVTQTSEGKVSFSFLHKWC